LDHQEEAWDSLLSQSAELLVGLPPFWEASSAWEGIIRILMDILSSEVGLPFLEELSLFVVDPLLFKEPFPLVVGVPILQVQCTVFKLQFTVVVGCSLMQGLLTGKE
jgi:hypothetical protein